MVQDGNNGVSVVLGSYNRLDFIKLTIDSIRSELNDSVFSYEIIVIDGGSTDGTMEWLIGQKDILTIIQHNRGSWNGQPIKRQSWGYFMNLGFKCAKGKYICMLSDDCLVVPGAINNGYALFEEKLNNNEKVGAIAFYFRNYPVDDFYYVGLSFGKLFVNHGMYHKKAIEDVGYIDEDSYFFYHADGDLCLKMWNAGYRCIDSPHSFIEHHAHANISIRNTNLDKQKKDWETYNNKWNKIFSTDIPEDKQYISLYYNDTTNTADRFLAVDSNLKKFSKLLYAVKNHYMRRKSS